MQKLKFKIEIQKSKLFKFTLLLLSFYFFFFTFPKGISAHVLKADGTIGAILHIDPDDDPIANQNAYFFFEFKDKQNKFQPSECSCTFSILEGGKEIYTQPLFQNNPNPSLSNSSVSYTFPQKDVYQVKVTGTPNTPGEFQPFSLTYDVRVDRVANSQKAQTSGGAPSYLIYLVAGVVMVGAFAGTFLFRRGK